MVHHAVAHAPKSCPGCQRGIPKCHFGNPKNLKVQANLAVCLLSAKRYDEAAAAFRQANALCPSDPAHSVMTPITPRSSRTGQL